MIFDMTRRNGGGEEYFVVPSTGCIYPKILNETITGFNMRRYGSWRWAYCTEMEEATVNGLSQAAGGSASDNIFSYCTKLKRLILPGFTASSTYLTTGCTALQAVQLGRVGQSVTSLFAGTFSGCTQSGLTITIYVNDSTTIPLANSPWGATNATIVYRSSTTGEVRTS